LRADLAAALTAAGRLLSSADVAAATNLAGAARELGVESADLVALEAELAAARALVEEQQRAARLETARARVQSGALFAPAGDSALDHLLGLEAVAPGFAGLAETWEAFRPAAVAHVQAAIDRGEWAAADTQLALLARAPDGPAAAAPLQAELAARRLQQSYLATPAPASVLTLVSAAPAVYPPLALERQIQGWVDLEFVVDRDGRPRNLLVREASPPGRFDAAALAAVEQYRYAPFEQDGRVYERLIRLRVRFQLQQVQ
jgi:TonB family protein